MGSGKVERLNRTLINMLKAIPESEKNNWKIHLPKLMFAYNSTVNKATGYSPFYLLFGRESRLPIDCLLPIEPNKVSNKTYADFVKKWKQSMKDAYQVVHQEMQKHGDYNKKKYDSKIKQVEVNVGDRVLVKNKKKGGTGKLRSNWEQQIYEVVSKDGMVPVYTVRPLGGKKTKNLHRNMLMRANHLPTNVFDPEEKPAPSPAKKKGQLKGTSNQEKAPDPVPSDSDSDSDIVVVQPREEILEELFDSLDEEEVPIELSSSSDEPEVAEDLNESSSTDEAEEPTIAYEMSEEEPTVAYEMTDDEMDPLEESLDTIETGETEYLDAREHWSDSSAEGSIDESETSSDDECPVRPQRARRPRKVYTYDEMGGEPRIKRYNVYGTKHLNSIGL
jgi:hypothetical protein